MWVGRIDNPIAEMFGISVPSMLGDEGATKKVLKSGASFFNKTIDDEIKRWL